jgi:aromatic ring-cleaving dioxygenase
MRTMAGWHGGPTAFAVHLGGWRTAKTGPHLPATGRRSMRTMAGWHGGPTTFVVRLGGWLTAKTGPHLPATALLGIDP